MMFITRVLMLLIVTWQNDRIPPPPLPSNINPEEEDALKDLKSKLTTQQIPQSSPP
jgi:hypothetical protein